MEASGAGADVPETGTDGTTGDFVCPACGRRYAVAGVCAVQHPPTNVVPLDEALGATEPAKSIDEEAAEAAKATETAKVETTDPTPAAPAAPAAPTDGAPGAAQSALEDALAALENAASHLRGLLGG